jgi:hypothetical protein
LQYSVRSDRSKVVVRARSSVHDTTTTWSKLAGTITVDPADPGAPGAAAAVTVDMREYDAGDRLKNWKIKGDLEPDKYPEALFTLAAIEGVRALGGGRFEASAPGTIRWRGRDARVRATGSATITPQGIVAECKFELNVTDLGVKPPKILMFKVEEVVEVLVTLEASAAA